MFRTLATFLEGPLARRGLSLLFLPSLSRINPAMKKNLLLFLIVFTSNQAMAASQLSRSQAKVVGAFVGAYSGALVGLIAGVAIGVARGQSTGGAIGGLIGIPVGAGLGALTGSLIAGSGYPDEEEEARLDFQRQFSRALVQNHE